jgi:hypothetical protein
MTETSILDWELIGQATIRRTSNIIWMLLQGILTMGQPITHSQVAYSFRNRVTGESRTIKANSEEEARATIVQLNRA